MEHASRSRRCGNEGVEARLRGRFRIFSARHRFRIEAAPRGKFRNDGGLGVVAVCFEGGCGGMCWPEDRSGTHAAAGAAARGVRGGLGDSFAVGLGAVAGAWVDHGSGQARMPPQERRHEEVFGLGDSFTCSGAAARGSWVFAAARGVCVFWFSPARMVLGVHFRQALRRHVGVDLRGGNAGMPQHQLH